MAHMMRLSSLTDETHLLPVQCNHRNPGMALQDADIRPDQYGLLAYEEVHDAHLPSNDLHPALDFRPVQMLAHLSDQSGTNMDGNEAHA